MHSEDTPPQLLWGCSRILPLQDSTRSSLLLSSFRCLKATHINGILTLPSSPVFGRPHSLPNNSPSISRNKQRHTPTPTPILIPSYGFPTSCLLHKQKRSSLLELSLEHSVVGSNELMVAKALGKIDTPEECDLHFFDILKFQKSCLLMLVLEFYF